MTLRLSILSLALLGVFLHPVVVSAEGVTVTVTIAPHCGDTIDNDGDSLIDFPNDPECDSALDATESAPPPTPPPSGGGGGGGGGGGSSSNESSDTQAIFRGKAYPGTKVTILKDAQIKAVTVASPDGSFDVTVKKLASGTYTFGVYGTDARGVQSATHTFTVSLTKDVTNVITGIFIPPTISIDKKEVRRGDILTILGQTTPASQVTVFVNSENEIVKRVNADASGAWLLNFDTAEIEYGNHSTQSRAAKANEISPLSKALAFKVGDRNVPFAGAAPTAGSSLGDTNGDSRVNLVDFSIVAYWFKRSGPPPAADLNGDGQVTLVDFSILAYNWSG